MQTRFSPVHDHKEWNSHLIHDLDGHLLQSWEWGEFKQRYGWRPERILWVDRLNRPIAAAQILERGVASRFSILYCPRGPAFDWSRENVINTVLSDLRDYTLSKKAIFLKVDPEIILDDGEGDEEGPKSDSVGEDLIHRLEKMGWQSSSEQIQFRNTMQLDLRQSEEELLAAMKQKTRYNVRLASRRGVRVRLGTLDDLDLLYDMYAETSIRDNFTIREPTYYHDAWGTFIEAGLAQPFIAEVEEAPVAGLIVYRFGDTAWYLYGMSRSIHRKKMPNYLLQWKATRWAKEMGCTTYDFWGAPDTIDPQDPMWGVYRFKEGFGARFVRTIGAWDLPTRPLLYQLYNALLPRLLAIMRIRGRTLTQRTLE